jgi:hypothetical protein
VTFHAFLAFYGFLCVFGLAIGWALGHRPSAMLATLGVFALLVTLPLGVGSLLDPELTRSDFFVADGALVVALALAEMGARLSVRHIAP